MNPLDEVIKVYPWSDSISYTVKLTSRFIDFDISNRRVDSFYKIEALRNWYASKR
jgi:hypothetical protein